MNALAADLQHYLQQSRDSLLRALDDLGEYDVRRPVMPSGTNLLGLVKHLAGIEAGYLGDCLGRFAPFRLPWVEDGSIWDSADMWATADESRDYIVDLYRAAWAHSDTAIADLPLDSPATVSWWPEERRSTTLRAPAGPRRRRDGAARRARRHHPRDDRRPRWPRPCRRRRRSMVEPLRRAHRSGGRHVQMRPLLEGHERSRAVRV